MTALTILFFYVLPAAGGWKVFEKAGLSGWVALIPILNWFGILRLLGRSYLWILAFVFFYPVTHFIASVMVAWRFGKSTFFGLGIALLPFVFIPLLGFGGARYLRPADA
jgi:hypothetical protein